LEGERGSVTTQLGGGSIVSENSSSKVIQSNKDIFVVTQAASMQTKFTFNIRKRTCYIQVGA